MILTGDNLQYTRKMKVKEFPISAGKLVCILNEVDAKDLGVFTGDRLELTNIRNTKKAVAIVDITKSEVKEKTIGLFEDLIVLLKTKSTDRKSVV